MVTSTVSTIAKAIILLSLMLSPFFIFNSWNTYDFTHLIKPPKIQKPHADLLFMVTSHVNDLAGRALLRDTYLRNASSMYVCISSCGS